MVDNSKKYSVIKNQKGQAVFELIIFIPFLIFLYTIFYTSGNSISGSINQQKAVRGYFYSLVKGNSYINNYAEVLELSNNHTMKMIGFSSLGWREKSVAGGRGAIAPCFDFSSILKNNTSETCEGSERDGVNSSRYVRTFTFYGVCGPVYTETSDITGKAFDINPSYQSNPFNCALSSSGPN